MMKLTKCFLAIGLATAFSACDMFEYHPYDLDVSGPTDINRTNIGIIERSMQGKNEFSFAVISDTQRWYDETEDAVKAINNRNDIDFVLHTGDLSDFGAKLEMVKQRDILNKLKVPYVCILGNHDCVATGELLFNKIFGPNNFAFSAGNIRFICLNTNALEFDYSEAVPDFGFISDQIANFPETAQKTIVAMHAGPYSEQFNNNTALVFQAYIRRFPQLQFCVYGHGHSVSVDDFFDDGTIYYQCACAKKRTFLHFKIHKDSYDYEVVEF